MIIRLLTRAYLHDIVRAQSEILEHKQLEILHTRLSHSRMSLDLIEQFLITLEQPELHDVARQGLQTARREFADEVARLEEMTV